jgi:hypothetical protein
VRDLPLKSFAVATPGYQLDYEYTERGQGAIDGLKPRVARGSSLFGDRSRP